MTYDTVEGLKASAEYQALGVLGRQRLLWATFPELHEEHQAETAAHLTDVAHGPPQPAPQEALDTHNEPQPWPRARTGRRL